MSPINDMIHEVEPEEEIEEHEFFKQAPEKTAAAKTLYHVTNTATVPTIKAKGILPLQTSNWVKGEDDERYGEGEIFAMDNPMDAIRWAAKMDWEFNKGMGTGKISIVAFTPGAEKWKTDSSDPISQGQNKGRWLKAVASIKPEQITASHVLTSEMVKSVVQGKEVKLGASSPKCPHCGSGDYGLMPSDFETAKCNDCGRNWNHGIVSGINDPYEKTADVSTKSYGMGTPIGGTGNPAGGAEGEGEDEDGNWIGLTSSEEDWDAENDRIYAMLDEEDERSERIHTATAKRLDNAAFTVASFKVASMDNVGWFAKSARPSEQKLELLQKQLKLTPEQIELCIAADPSPNQSDFVAWIAKYFAKGAFQLPEDTEKMRGQLENFQKLKKSPAFTFSKDIQQYDPTKLFETLETAASTMQSKKEQKRELVSKGAEIVVNNGGIKIYKVTEPKAAKELGGGTNWCTAPPNNTMAAHYLQEGPLYIFFDAGSAVAQLHCESNQFMNRQDVCILESVTGDAEYGQDLKKFLSDPGMLKALRLLTEKEPKVKQWVEENIADPTEVAQILGEAAVKEQEYNVGLDKEIAQYEKEVAEYPKKVEDWEKKMRRIQPNLDKYQQDIDAYRQKMDEYYKTDGMERPRPPERPQTPDQPREPRDPRWQDLGAYGYRYRNQTRPYARGKKFTVQVRYALSSGTPLPPEVEQQLVGVVDIPLLIKYAALFYPGKPWQPLGDAILADAKSKGYVDKDAIDYAAKFIKGPWPELEPYLLQKLFLVTKNMENMRNALDYAIRARKIRWPEFEDKIAKAKPGAASGYGAAEYAIRVLKQPWSALPDIKRKKNGKINAEECMIIGAPGEARKYSEAFSAGQRWEAFEESALAANNLAALINYAADTLKTRMPALEEKILSGEKDAQEDKGRQRYHQYTDLPLDYSLKVIKGRWPEYEQKILKYAKTEIEKNHSDEYKPSVSQQWGDRNRLDRRVANYIEQVIKGRWPEFEQVLLGRYQEHPALWSQNQNLIDGYLVTIDKACQNRYRNNSPAAADETDVDFDTEEDVPLTDQPMGTRPQKPDERTVLNFTKFKTDQQCYWPEGEQRLVTRDPGYEKIIVDNLRERVKDKSWGSTKENKITTPEELAAMERPEGGLSYEQRETKPNAVIWNGIWIGWYGMEQVEKYVDYMLANGQTWEEGVDIMELHEELTDVQGRYRFQSRPQRRQKSSRKQAVSPLLRKTLLPLALGLGLAPSSGNAVPREPQNMSRIEIEGIDTPIQTQEQDTDPMVGVTDPKRLLKAPTQRIDKNVIDPWSIPVKRPSQLKTTSLLKKKALIDIEPAPSLLPPRDDLKGHMDQQMHDQMTKEVMKGVREPLNPKKKNRRPQINPLVNPDGVVASANGKSEIRIRFKGKEQLFPVAPQDVMKAVRHAENLSMANPGFPVVFILEEEGITSEDTYINGNHVGDTLEKTSAEYTQQDVDDDETTEIWLDQVEDSEDEAKRHFMEEDYLKQIAQDDGVTMEELWNDMGEEYTAEFYGYPYKRESDFTDESTVGINPEANRFS